MSQPDDRCDRARETEMHLLTVEMGRYTFHITLLAIDTKISIACSMKLVLAGVGLVYSCVYSVCFNSFLK